MPEPTSDSEFASLLPRLIKMFVPLHDEFPTVKFVVIVADYPDDDGPWRMSQFGTLEDIALHREILHQALQEALDRRPEMVHPDDDDDG